MHGSSMLGLIDGREARREYAYNEWDVHPSRCGAELQLRTVRTKRHKLTLELTSGAGEMYDLVEDPFDMDNLFGDPGYRTIQKELIEMISARPDDVMRPAPQPIGMA